MLRKKAPLALLASLTLLAGNALAQPPSEDDFDKDPEDTIASKQQTKEEAESGDKMPGEKDEKAQGAEKESEIWDTREDPKKAYRYLGLRFRDAIVPRGILNIFADGGANVNVPMGGIEFGTRRDHLELVFSLSYADYSKANMLFKGKGEPDEAYERIQSDLAIIYGKVEILYDIPLDTKSRFTLQIGGGVGVGGVIGDLYRRQVYPGTTGADPGEPTQWNDCNGPDSPPNGYCNNDNNHFRDYTEPSWANGGSKPFIFPWMALPQVSFRYKPIKYLQARADVGLALTTGPYFGFSVGYIL
ncbi:hypothetical protein [Polyangium aurulentum]|uniref:hypothetical protein n=1 Tax=Polyangium aurulentum TaxID=2567896 RepID=UPI0010AE688E|nr:hypothetical protein [Polyangium aurulentum]UQA59590.1 hypothetical protein E8A73_003510 [Polyangium aurulentum]